MSLVVLLFYGFAFTGLIISLFIFYRAFKKETEFITMALLLFMQSMIVIENVFYWSKLYTSYPYFYNITYPILLLFGPLVFFHIELVCKMTISKKQYLLHLIPFLVVLLLMIPFYFANGEMKLFHYKSIKWLINIDIIPYFIMTHMTAYSALNFYKIKRHRYVGNINQWLLLLNSLFSLYILCYIFYYFGSSYPWYSLSTDYFVSLGSCLSIVAIIYFSLSHSNVFNGLHINDPISIGSTVSNSEMLQTNHNEPQINKYKNSSLSESARLNLAAGLNNLMHREKLYRENDLKLEILAQKLGTDRHYVSQVINQHFGVNFFEYINMLRIDEAKEMLHSSQAANLNIIEIAYQVGYNTKNTFNAAFKRIVGMTPTEYRFKINESKTFSKD
jgi:AraC-like DNA-binding protein